MGLLVCVVFVFYFFNNIKHVFPIFYILDLQKICKRREKEDISEGYIQVSRLLLLRRYVLSVFV